MCAESKIWKCELFMGQMYSLIFYRIELNNDFIHHASSFLELNVTLRPVVITIILEDLYIQTGPDLITTCD